MNHSTIIRSRCLVVWCAISTSVFCSADDAKTTSDYPGKSIGGLTNKMNTLLKKPGARLIHHLATPPSGSGGVTFSGLQFASFDIFSVKTNPEGSLLTLTIYSCEQRRGSKVVTSNRSLEIADIDPSQFKSVVPSFHEGLTNAIPAGAWVVVESKQKLNATQFLVKGKERKIVLPRFGMGFTTLAAAIEVTQILKDIQTRAEFEAEVKKLPELPTYTKRSDLYQKIHEELHNQNTNIGFFGAASSTTALFAVPLPGVPRFSPESDSFMRQLSQELSRINVEPALELLRKGTLTTATRKLKDFKEIDQEIVQREQVHAEMLLNKLEEKQRASIVSNVNDVSNSWVNITLGDLSDFKVVKSMIKVRDAKKLTDGKSAQLDYGVLRERIKIGETTAEMLR